MEFKRDRHDPGKGNKRDFRQTRQIDHAEAVRGDIANDKPEENGKLLIERVCFKIPRKAGDKRDGADDQVILGAKIWIAKAAAKRIGPDGKQGETDGRHDGRRHDRRDKFPPPGGAKAKDTFQYTADERSTKDCTIAILGTDDAGYGDEGEADPHDDRQTAAKTPDWEKLEKRADAGYDHRRLHECRRLRRIHFDSTGYDEDRRDIGHEHGKYMLQSERNRFSDCDFPIGFINRIFFHNTLLTVIIIGLSTEIHCFASLRII